jgi:hypothetical protein
MEASAETPKSPTKFLFRQLEPGCTSSRGTATMD